MDADEITSACLNGDEATIKSMVKVSGPSVLNLAPKHGKFPLMIAVLQLNESLVRLLISLGANVNQKTARGRQALPAAVARDSLAIVKLLVDNGADTEIPGISLFDLCKSSAMKEFIVHLRREVPLLEEDTLYPGRVAEVAELSSAIDEDREPEKTKHEVATGSEKSLTRTTEEKDEKRLSEDRLDEAAETRRIELEATKKRLEEAERVKKADKEAAEKRRKEEEERLQKETDQKKLEAEKDQEIERLKAILAEQKRIKEEKQREVELEKQLEVERLKEMLAEKNRRKLELEQKKLDEELAKKREIERLKESIALAERNRQKEIEKAREIERLRKAIERDEPDPLDEELENLRIEMRKAEENERLRLAPIAIVKNAPNWDTWKPTTWFQAERYDITPPTTLYGILNGHSTRTFTKDPSRGVVFTQPFAKGDSRFVSYMLDMASGERLVAKEYEEGNTHYRHSVAAEILGVASAFAREFNALNPPKKVHFVTAAVYKGCNTEVLAETWLDGEFHKFDTSHEYSATSQAFSHFTYQASKGQCCIVDLRGVKRADSYHYSTPVIHTNGADLRFKEDVKNLGSKGVSLFMGAHVCNKVCQYLGLKVFAIQPTFVSHKNKGTMSHS